MANFKKDPPKDPPKDKPKNQNILYVESKNDPNYKAYADSLHLYNESMKPRLTSRKSFGEYGSYGLRGRNVTDVPLPEGYTVPGPIQPIGQRITRGYYPEYVIMSHPPKPAGKDYRKKTHNIYKKPTREVIVGKPPVTEEPVVPTILNNYYTPEPAKQTTYGDGSTSTLPKSSFSPFFVNLTENGREAQNKYFILPDWYTDPEYNTYGVEKLWQKFDENGKPTLMRTKVAKAKFETGGIGDPIKANPAPNQPFPSYYESNKEAFDAADETARSYMNNWFNQRAGLTNPDGTQKYPAAPLMSNYLQNSGQSVYIPQGGSISKTNISDASGYASTANYNFIPGPDAPQKDKDYYTALSKNPFGYNTEGMEKIREGLGRKAVDLGDLQTNTAYYFANPDYQGNIVDYGKQPAVHLEEQLHLASNYAESKDPLHKALFKDKAITDAINSKNIESMGYQGMDKNAAKYFGDTQEFYPRLMSARRTFGLDPTKEYSAEDMSKFLDEGYHKIIDDKYTEPGQKEHLIEFYKQLGYPTPSSQFMQNNPSQEQIDSAKKKAAENFRLTNEKFAMNDAEDKIFRGRKGGFPCYTCKSLKSEVTKKFRNAGFETDPPPTTLPVDEDIKMREDYAKQMAELEAQRSTYAKRLAAEQARVNKVRSNVIPAAYALDRADDNLSTESLNAFWKSKNAQNPQELKEAIKNYPAELRNVLPKGGNYNIATWDAANNSWKNGSGPDRELYCTPYGCFTYQKAGAKDVPIVGGNYGFVGGVKKGELPFKEISDKEALQLCTGKLLQVILMGEG